MGQIIYLFKDVVEFTAFFLLYKLYLNLENNLFSNCFFVVLNLCFRRYPAKCKELPISIVVGERDVFKLERDAKKASLNNITVGGASLPIPYGTHHTKLSVLESDLGRLHIIISTANLVQGDWENKMQAFYHCSGVGF